MGGSNGIGIIHCDLAVNVDSTVVGGALECVMQSASETRASPPAAIGGGASQMRFLFSSPSAGEPRIMKQVGNFSTETISLFPLWNRCARSRGRPPTDRPPSLKLSGVRGCDMGGARDDDAAADAVAELKF